VTHKKKQDLDHILTNIFIKQIQKIKQDQLFA